MGLVAVDIFNLANASQAAFTDSRNLFLAFSITLARFQETTLAFAKRLDPTKFGLTPDFIDKSKILLDDCNKVTKSGHSTAQQLKDLENHFRKFYDDKDPEKVFRDLSIELSQVVGQYGLIASSITMDQDSVNRMINQVGTYVEDYRYHDDFEDEPPNVKKSADTKIVNSTLKKYLLVFDLPSVPI